MERTVISQPFHNLSYKELQKIAIAMELPANYKRNFMVSLIQAKIAGNKEAVKQIINVHKDRQLQKNMAEKPAFIIGRGSGRGRGRGRSRGRCSATGRNALSPRLPCVQEEMMGETPLSINGRGSGTGTQRNTEPSLFPHRQVNMAYGQMQEMPLRSLLPETTDTSQPLRETNLTPVSEYILPNLPEIYDTEPWTYSPHGTPVITDHQQIHSRGNCLTTEDLQDNLMYSNYGFRNECQQIQSPVNNMVNQDIQQDFSSGNNLTVQDIRNNYLTGHHLATNSPKMWLHVTSPENHLSSVMVNSSTGDSGINSPDISQERSSRQFPDFTSSCHTPCWTHAFEDKPNQLNIIQQDSDNQINFITNTQNTPTVHNLEIPENSQLQSDQYFQNPKYFWSYNGSVESTARATTTTTGMFSTYSMEPTSSESSICIKEEMEDPLQF